MIPTPFAHTTAQNACIYEDRGNSDVVHVFGEIDLSSSPELETMLDQCGAGRRVIVDLSECSYADSSVLAVLVRAHKRFGNKLCVVAREGGTIRRLFRITGVDTLFALEPTLEAADSR
ncbi:MAG: STAS domain-containing protein [Candidatus Eremiobacteraeota bacterium]|nr:STAS domain-containing protein [Candidatus Eremiobacteraeota bacterium]